MLHLCDSLTPGCFRCELNEDEVVSFPRTPSWHGLSGTDEPLEPLRVNLTVYRGEDEVTVVVREDSIQMQGRDLIAEGHGKDMNRLFTFPNVIGYSTHH